MIKWIKKTNKKYLIILLVFTLITIIPFAYSKYMQKLTRYIVINSVQPTYTVAFNANSGTGTMEN